MIIDAYVALLTSLITMGHRSFSQGQGLSSCMGAFVIPWQLLMWGAVFLVAELATSSDELFVFLHFGP